MMRKLATWTVCLTVALCVGCARRSGGRFPYLGIALLDGARGVPFHRMSPSDALPHLWRIANDSKLVARSNEESKWLELGERIEGANKVQVSSVRFGDIPDFELVRVEGKVTPGPRRTVHEFTVDLLRFHVKRRLTGEVDDAFISKVVRVNGRLVGMVSESGLTETFPKGGAWSTVSVDAKTGKFVLLTYRRFP